MNLFWHTIWCLKINRLLATPIYKRTGKVLVRHQDAKTKKAFRYKIESGSKFFQGEANGIQG
jgi:hypothetical protein